MSTPTISTILKDKKVKPIRHFSFFSLILFFSISNAWTRPLFTEEAHTRGFLNFEAGLGISQRFDTFGTPEFDYESVLIPARVRLGFHDRLDIGFTLRHASQVLETQTARISGSQNAQFSPEFKWRFSDTAAFQFIWHLGQSEEQEDFPLARGNDLEFMLAYSPDTPWKTHINVGYVLTGDYNSNFGIIRNPPSEVDPGNIFEANGAIEIPLLFNISLLGELLYNDVSDRDVDGQTILNSAGESLDIVGGVTWSYSNWNIGGAVAFGLLDESHTSFAIDRGAGDVMFKLNVSYKLLRAKFKR